MAQLHEVYPSGPVGQAGGSSEGWQQGFALAAGLCRGGSLPLPRLQVNYGDVANVDDQVHEAIMNEAKAKLDPWKDKVGKFAKKSA